VAVRKMISLSAKHTETGGARLGKMLVNELPFGTAGIVQLPRTCDAAIAVRAGM
jgi:hypothetical protein